MFLSNKAPPQQKAYFEGPETLLELNAHMGMSINADVTERGVHGGRTYYVCTSNSQLTKEDFRRARQHSGFDITFQKCR